MPPPLAQRAAMQPRLLGLTERCSACAGAISEIVALLSHSSPVLQKSAAELVAILAKRQDVNTKQAIINSKAGNGAGKVNSSHKHAQNEHAAIVYLKGAPPT